MALDEFETRFVVEYLLDLNGRAAARRAGAGGTDPSVASRAWRTLHKPEVQDALAAAFAARNDQVNIDAAEVLREIHAIATADTNEIVEIRRGCCRNCHGTEFRHQFTDQRELNRAQTLFRDTAEGLVEAFEHGGLGFDPKREPHPECPVCSGEGSAYVFLKDTRTLSRAARALYAGAKQTKDGIEVKLHSKDKHLELLMRHLGLLNDKLELKGDIAERILKARKRSGAT